MSFVTIVLSFRFPVSSSLRIPEVTYESYSDSRVDQFAMDGKNMIKRNILQAGWYCLTIFAVATTPLTGARPL